MAFFKDGITYGIKHNCADITLYVGHWIISIKTEFHSDFIKKVSNGTWPDYPLTIIKPGSISNYSIWNYICDIVKKD